MKVTRAGDGRNERLIVTGLITNRAVLGAVSELWDGKMFQSRWANIVAGWCVDHYRKFRKPPARRVQSLFDRWAAKNEKDKDTVGLVSSFLADLSAEYKVRKRDVDPGYLTDLAREFFDRVRLETLKEEVQGLLDDGDVKEAWRRVGAVRQVELGTGGKALSPLADKEARRRAFTVKDDVLITYPGALGEFFGDALAREGLIAVHAPEKRGKCIEGTAKVVMADGSVRTIRDIVEQKIKTPILSLNEETQKFVPVQVSEFWSNGVKDCWEVKTRTGRRVVTTSNHKYLAPGGWREVRDIKKGEYVAVPKTIPVFGTQRSDLDRLRFLAFMLAEGGCTWTDTSTNATFSGQDPETVALFKSTCLGLGVKWKQQGPCGYQLSGNARPLIRTLGMAGHSAKTKTIPDWVFTCPKEQVAEFLRVFFTCDGSIHQDRHGSVVQLTLANRRMLRQISHLLLRFGVVHRFCRKDATFQGRVFPAWRINISSQEYVNLFLREINFYSYKKREQLPEEGRKSFLDKLPYEVADRLYQELKESCPRETGNPGGLYRVFGRKQAMTVRQQIIKRQPLMRQSFRHVANHPVVSKYLNSHVLWDQVVSVKYLGKRETYDLTVPDHHNFIADDVVVHNSTILLELMFRAMVLNRKVAMFQLGDLSETQFLRRFYARVCGRPFFATRPGRVERMPEYLAPPTAQDGLPDVRHKERRWESNLPERYAEKKLARLRKRHGRDAFRLSVHPARTLSVNGMANILARWEEDGWKPDVVVCDYAELFAALDGKATGDREQVNQTWLALASLRLAKHYLIVTATQTDADSYDSELITMKNFSEDKRKHSHVTGSFALNQTDEEKELGLYRMNWLTGRDWAYSSSKFVYAAGCAATQDPWMFSTF